MKEVALASPEEIIDEARNGRMFILVDDEDRENEGDLVIAAQMATPDAINFMAIHGRGLIGLALTKERVEQLGLELMSRNNGSRHETAFTVSIEAREGVTTGISAADRARTVAVAIDSANGPEQIVSPGHVFPLVARPGGVLVRAGHTEAAVDVARLAGLIPAGVICEVMGFWWLTNQARPAAGAWNGGGGGGVQGGGPADIHELRDYGIGAQILAELGVHEMVLLTNTAQAPVALAGYGIRIVGQRPIPGLP